MTPLPLHTIDSELYQLFQKCTISKVNYISSIKSVLSSQNLRLLPVDENASKSCIQTNSHKLYKLRERERLCKSRLIQIFTRPIILNALEGWFIIACMQLYFAFQERKESAICSRALYCTLRT